MEGEAIEVHFEAGGADSSDVMGIGACQVTLLSHHPLAPTLMIEGIQG